MGEKSKLFVRDATGLVRALSTRDAFLINMGILNFLAGVPLAFTTILFLFPGVDVPSAFLIGFLASIPFALVYIQMGAAMPRSGGDYAWVSRTLHPALGFMTSFSLYFISFYCCLAAISYTFSTFFLSDSFAILATLTGNTALSSLSTLTAEPVVGFAIAAIILVIMAIITATGIQVLRWTFYVLIGLMLLGSVIIMVIFATTSNSAFVAAFNHYSGGLGSTYQGVINTATKAGYTSHASPFAALAALPVTLISYGGFTYSAYTAGEIRRADKALNRSIFLALGIGLLLWTGSAYFMFSSVGSTWLNAAAYLSYAAPASNPLSVPASYPLLISVLTIGNPVVYWLIFVGFVAAYLVFLPSYFQVLTRAIFAWSFDRMAPGWLADVNERFHTPVKAIAVTLICAIAFVGVWAFGSVATVYINSTIAWTAIFLVPAIAAIVFPFRKKELFEGAPEITKKKILGIPLVSISGAALFILILAAVAYGYLTPAYSGPTSLPAIAISASFFIVGLALFYIMKAYRRRQGVDIDKIYSEIPPE